MDGTVCEMCCRRCGGTPIIRLYRVSWFSGFPHWRAIDCGPLKCAWLNYLGRFVGVKPDLVLVNKEK